MDLVSGSALEDVARLDVFWDLFWVIFAAESKREHLRLDFTFEAELNDHYLMESFPTELSYRDGCRISC